jgi:hypothetical protein
MKTCPALRFFLTAACGGWLAGTTLTIAAVMAPLALVLSITAGFAQAGEEAPVFQGSWSEWHDGFARFDYEMDEATLAITPFKAPEAEKFGVRDPAPGKRRCLVIAPKTPAAGHPWSWQGCYWDHQPQTEVALLHRGFHIAYLSANATLKPGREWEAWYAFLMEKCGLSTKPAFVGMSRGGEYAYTWATQHPDAVSCIHVDNPGGNRGMLMKLGDLADRDIPLLHVCGSIDPLLNRYANVIEGIYQQWGGRVTTMIKEGAGHHPHSLQDARPIADWIERSVMAAPPVPPSFAGSEFTRTSYYSDEAFFREYPAERQWITCRGPGFVPCFQRWQFPVPGADNTITVITPEKPAEGMPWVFRSDPVSRSERVDPALLAAGFHIVTGPVSYNSDGPQLRGWEAVYDYLTARGIFQKARAGGTRRCRRGCLGLGGGSS